MIRRYFAARNLNAFIQSADALKNELPLSPEIVAHAKLAITGLHKALLQRAEPTYEKPDYPFDGWGLTATPYSMQSIMFGVPALMHLGDRSFYLSDRAPGDLLRVLSIPHPHIISDMEIVRVKHTTVPQALAESPNLYHGFMNAADELIEECGLTYEMPPPLIEGF